MPLNHDFVPGSSPYVTKADLADRLDAFEENAEDNYPAAKRNGVEAVCDELREAYNLE